MDRFIGSQALRFGSMLWIEIEVFSDDLRSYL